MAKSKNAEASASPLSRVVANLPPRKRTTKKDEILIAAALMLEAKAERIAKTQGKVSAELDIGRQPTISNIKTSLDSCGIEFLKRLPDDIPLSVLKEFADKCQCERRDLKEDPEYETPALKYLGMVISDSVKCTLLAMKACLQKPLPASQGWWGDRTLYAIVQNPLFIEKHPAISAMLLDYRRHPTMEEWLAAHPSPAAKSGVTKAKK